MKRNIPRTSFRKLLQHIHANRSGWQPTRTWRQAVMEDVARIHASVMAVELDRLAPRFTFAAAVISVASLLAATWSLNDLPGQLFAVLSSHALQLGPLGLGL
ncbi:MULTISPECIES: hypothetical protein [unclassified Pseudodesulfovibrio]|uniref:hypothetical protein n=1 Tax=unclassified Pseudodesulfovibrio TaxID=2661612 RepID=UPI000FEB94EF|nr:MULTISPECIES: hypothetical protein [unclassified Pseudodesulfovibrio]MCJ2163627.1 hypothetical protein [Pseudodesulfovibrio sp. S3-i]RWU06856.1 hypothetical protein DWB63_03605 [Pseudodesulfovibrio sp. S3]